MPGIYISVESAITVSLTDCVEEQWGIEARLDCLVFTITNVEVMGQCWKKGIRKGFVIEKFNGKKITNNNCSHAQRCLAQGNACTLKLRPWEEYEKYVQNL